MKQAIFFPGIGYHCDKPLFYYSTKLCQQAQYEIHQLAYTNLSRSIPEAFDQAYAQTEAQLAHVHWDACDEILFVSKSLGTAVAAAYAKRHHISCRNIYYTPLAETFDFAPQPGIVFHGTSDPWAKTAVIKEKCREYSLPLHIIEHTNHSLEVQAHDLSDRTVPSKNHTVLQNLCILEEVMAFSEMYITHELYFRPLSEKELCRSLFAGFIRRQQVVKCWRREHDQWVIKDAPFIDDWSEEDYQFLLQCLKNTIQTGGFVYGAFSGKMPNATLKGFVSVESAFLGSTQQYLDLSCIHVSEDQRGKGIGAVLFREAKNWAKKKGGKKLYISAHSAVETQAFYQMMGCVDAEEYDPHHVEAEPFDRQLECIL